MDREKLEGAKEGILALLETLDPQDYVIWIPFADSVKPGLQGTMRDIGPRLRAEVQGEKEGRAGPHYSMRSVLRIRGLRKCAGLSRKR